MYVCYLSFGKYLNSYVINMLLTICFKRSWRLTECLLFFHLSCFIRVCHIDGDKFIPSFLFTAFGVIKMCKASEVNLSLCE
uniref:Uncharacterized protein n=1 Tax=Trichobilharzia regenti TaxID=157069 RepID=A0AA85J2J6_TRIRE|nr:unnamed protein product [Trichobilharzia regenti]